VEVTFQAAMRVEANLLIHAGVGMTKPDDIKYNASISCYEHALKYYPEHTTMLSLLPLTTRMAGPREALLSAIVHKNYGCTHMIVGDTYADPWNTCGKRFYDTREAAKTMGAHEEELGIVAVPVEDVVYVSESMRFQRVSEVAAGETVFDISNNDLMQRLEKGEDLPSWFTFPEVLSELKRSSPPRHKQGYTVFLTGLSGSGKSTIANALLVKLLELGDRPVTLLDGDLVRKHLSSELGFSKHHRDLNVLRIGYVASEISKNGGVAICAPIAPYQQTREQVRHLIQSVGGFVEVHVSTPITVCEKRDRKGLYAKARAGLVKEFTGIDDPYQTPENPELRIDTSDGSPEEAAQQILLKLEHLGFLGRGRTRAES
jgi:sulfate adenylyltransferase